MRDVYFRNKDKWSQPTRNWLHFTERTICAIKSNSDLLHLNYTRLHQLSWRINKKSVALLFTISHEMTRQIVQSHEKNSDVNFFFPMFCENFGKTRICIFRGDIFKKAILLTFDSISLYSNSVIARYLRCQFSNTDCIEWGQRVERSNSAS